MKKLELIYEGKAKKVFRTDDPLLYVQEFKDDATAFNAKKKGTIENKGVVNNKISSALFTLLEKEGVPTHLVERISDREMVVKKLEIIPVEVTVRNITAGGICRQLGVKEGMRLKKPVLEWHYKSDPLDDPLMNDDHIEVLGCATREEMKLITRYTYKINEVLIAFFSQLGIDLVDFKVEFGRHQGQILLGDEISPDTCRFWEKGTGKKLDKDRFRQDLGSVEEAYQEMLSRIGA